MSDIYVPMSVLDEDGTPMGDGMVLLTSDHPQYEEYLEWFGVEKKGGPGSGHAGHAGRPGLVGGSLPTRYVGSKDFEDYKKDLDNLPMQKDLVNAWPDNPEMWRKDFGSNPDGFILQYVDWLNRRSKEQFDMTPEAYVEAAGNEFRKQLSDSNVYMRITPENLEEALREGQFENTFTSKRTGAAFRENKLSYKTYLRHRKEGEQDALGIPSDAEGTERPVYGYWSKVEGGFSDDKDRRLDQYGVVSVEFDKDKISNHLTFTDSDSLDLSDRVRSSDWRNPSAFSSFGMTNGTNIIDIAERGPDDIWSLYWEAQIFDKSASNIKAVHSKVPLSQSLIDLLEEKGIPWSIQQ